jgi:hypothetical protein
MCIHKQDDKYGNCEMTIASHRSNEYPKRQRRDVIPAQPTGLGYKIT